MHLSSIIENDGLKSKKHYLITHHNDRHDLLALPGSYTDLEKEVKRLYHIDGGQFYLETEEFNLCRGTRVRIPKEAWDDVAQLIGNLHIVPSRRGLTEVNPESAKGDEERSIETAVQGEIPLNQSFEEGSVLLVKIGRINLDIPVTPSTELRLQLLDSRRNSALAISVFSQSVLFKTPAREGCFNRTLKEVFPLESQHEIVVHQRGARYQLLCDRQVIGQVEGSNFFLGTVSYDLGARSPFDGPLTAVAYTGMDEFLKGAPQYQSVLPFLGSEALYQQVVACNPSYSSDIQRQFSEIRSRPTGSGVNWRKQNIVRSKWLSLEWDYHKKSIFVIRTSTTLTVPKSSSIFFNPRHPKYSLVVTVQGNYERLNFWYLDENGNRVEAGLLELSQSARLPGEHTIAFVRHQNKIHIVVDFCKSFALPDTMFIRRKPGEIQFNVPSDWGLEADVYEF